jgi:hypothetical protein
MNVKIYRNKKLEISLLLFFILVNAVLYTFSIEGAPSLVGADVGQYLRPARSLVDLGVFSLNPPGWVSDMGDGRLFTIGAPLYSVFLSIPYYLFGDGTPEFYLFIVIFQCFFLYVTGWVARSALLFFDKEGKYVFALHILVIFNPNSLITAHLIQSETLFTLFLMLTILYLFKMVGKFSIKYMFLVGVSAGILSLIRPAGIYVIYILPLLSIFMFFFKDFLGGHYQSSKKHIFSVLLIPIAAASITISPWLIRNYINTGEYFFSTMSGYYLYDNHIQLLQKGRGYTWEESVEKAHNQLLDSLKNKNFDPNCVDNRRHWKCHKAVFKSLLPYVVEQPLEAQMKALLYSWGTLYLTGGASNIRNYLGYEGNSLIVDYQNKKFNGFNSVLELFKKAETPYLLILSVTMLFVFVARITALIGIYRMVNSDKSNLYLLILIILLLLFTAMYLYLGQSRFRVPLEPILMILSILFFINKRH